MYKIKSLNMTLAAGSSDTKEIDCTLVVKGVAPIIRKIWQNDIEAGRATIAIRHKEREIDVCEATDLSAFHRANQEKFSIDMAAGKLAVTMSNNSAADISPVIFVALEYPGVI